MTVNISFPETCINNSCFDEATIKKFREGYDKALKENYARNIARPNELNDTRKRPIQQL